MKIGDLVIAPPDKKIGVVVVQSLSGEHTSSRNDVLSIGIWKVQWSDGTFGLYYGNELVIINERT